jgi:hypothetical protein
MSFLFCDDVLVGSEPLSEPVRGLKALRSVGRGARVSKADTLYEACSDSDDMVECIEPGMGSEMSDVGFEVRPRPVLARLLSFFIGRPAVQESAAGLSGV